MKPSSPITSALPFHPYNSKIPFRSPLHHGLDHQESSMSYNSLRDIRLLEIPNLLIRELDFYSSYTEPSAPSSAYASYISDAPISSLRLSMDVVPTMGAATTAYNRQRGNLQRYMAEERGRRTVLRQDPRQSNLCHRTSFLL